MHQDSKLEELAAKTKEAFGRIDIELLRQSAEERARVIEETQALINDSGSYSRNIILAEDEPEPEPPQETTTKNTERTDRQ